MGLVSAGFAIKRSGMSIGGRRIVSAICKSTLIYTQNTLRHLANPPKKGHKHCLQPGCAFDGPDQAALAYHLKRDHFQCEGCKRILPSQTKLNQHYDSCSFAVACPQCGEHCAGKTQLALHLEHCYFCEECGFHTHHEGNYHIVSPRNTGFSFTRRMKD